MQNPTLLERLDPPVRATPPGAHLGLQWRSLNREDLLQVEHLIRRAHRAEGRLHSLPPGYLQGAYAAMESTTYADTLVGCNRYGEIRALGVVAWWEGREVPAVRLWAETDPDWHGQGIGRSLLGWQLDRARQILIAALGPDYRGPVEVCALVESHHARRRRLYLAAGFSAKSSGLILRRPLQGADCHRIDLPPEIQLRKSPQVRAGSGEVASIAPLPYPPPTPAELSASTWQQANPLRPGGDGGNGEQGQISTWWLSEGEQDLAALTFSCEDQSQSTQPLVASILQVSFADAQRQAQLHRPLLQLLHQHLAQAAVPFVEVVLPQAAVGDNLQVGPNPLGTFYNEMGYQEIGQHLHYSIEM